MTFVLVHVGFERDIFIIRELERRGEKRWILRTFEMGEVNMIMF